MNVVKSLAGVAGTAVIAGWVAYAVSAPRNFENAMNQPMEALDGNSINQEVKQARDEARSEQCIRFKELAAEAWERSLDNGTSERDATEIDRLDRQVERYCG